MTALERTAYPRFKRRPSGEELAEVYTPTDEDLVFVRGMARGASPTLMLMVLLKSFERLGYLPVAGLPFAIIGHTRTSLRLPSDTELDVTPRTLYRHIWLKNFRRFCLACIWSSRSRKLSVTNWTQADTAFTAAGYSRDTWAAIVPSAQLHEGVPGHVRALFATVGGTILYSYFFYPLITLGVEQLTRVAEAAVFSRYQDAGGPRRHKTSKDRITWLENNGGLSKEQTALWDSFVQRRTLTILPSSRAYRLWPLLTM